MSTSLSRNSTGGGKASSQRSDKGKGKGGGGIPKNRTGEIYLCRPIATREEERDLVSDEDIKAMTETYTGNEHDTQPELYTALIEVLQEARAHGAGGVGNTEDILTRLLQICLQANWWGEGYQGYFGRALLAAEMGGDGLRMPELFGRALKIHCGARGLGRTRSQVPFLALWNTWAVPHLEIVLMMCNDKYLDDRPMVSHLLDLEVRDHGTHSIRDKLIYDYQHARLARKQREEIICLIHAAGNAENNETMKAFFITEYQRHDERGTQPQTKYPRQDESDDLSSYNYTGNSRGNEWKEVKGAKKGRQNEGGSRLDRPALDRPQPKARHISHGGNTSVLCDLPEDQGPTPLWNTPQVYFERLIKNMSPKYPNIAMAEWKVALYAGSGRDQKLRRLGVSQETLNFMRHYTFLDNEDLSNMKTDTERPFKKTDDLAASWWHVAMILPPYRNRDSEIVEVKDLGGTAQPFLKDSGPTTRPPARQGTIEVDKMVERHFLTRDAEYVSGPEDEMGFEVDDRHFSGEYDPKRTGNKCNRAVIYITRVNVRDYSSIIEWMNRIRAKDGIPPVAIVCCSESIDKGRLLAMVMQECCPRAHRVVIHEDQLDYALYYILCEPLRQMIKRPRSFTFVYYRMDGDLKAREEREATKVPTRMGAELLRSLNVPTLSIEAYSTSIEPIEFWMNAYDTIYELTQGPSHKFDWVQLADTRVEEAAPMELDEPAKGTPETPPPTDQGNRWKKKPEETSLLEEMRTQMAAEAKKHKDEIREAIMKDATAALNAAHETKIRELEERMKQLTETHAADAREKEKRLTEMNERVAQAEEKREKLLKELEANAETGQANQKRVEELERKLEDEPHQVTVDPGSLISIDTIYPDRGLIPTYSAGLDEIHMVMLMTQLRSSKQELYKRADYLSRLVGHGKNAETAEEKEVKEWDKLSSWRMRRINACPKIIGELTPLVSACKNTQERESTVTAWVFKIENVREVYKQALKASAHPLRQGPEQMARCRQLIQMAWGTTNVTKIRAAEHLTSISSTTGMTNQGKKGYSERAAWAQNRINAKLAVIDANAQQINTIESEGNLDEAKTTAIQTLRDKNAEILRETIPLRELVDIGVLIKRIEASLLEFKARGAICGCGLEFCRTLPHGQYFTSSKCPICNEPWKASTKHDAVMLDDDRNPSKEVNGGDCYFWACRGCAADLQGPSGLAAYAWWLMKHTNRHRDAASGKFKTGMQWKGAYLSMLNGMALATDDNETQVKIVAEWGDGDDPTRWIPLEEWCDELAARATEIRNSFNSDEVYAEETSVQPGAALPDVMPSEVMEEGATPAGYEMPAELAENTVEDGFTMTAQEPDTAEPLDKDGDEKMAGTAEKEDEKPMTESGTSILDNLRKKDF